MDPCRDPTISELLQFLRANNWVNKDDLQVVDFADTGRGIRTNRGRDFSPGETLIDLPFRGTLISMITLMEDKGFRKHCLDTLSDSALPVQLLLSIYVLYHRHLIDNHHQDSKWKAYIRSLPTTLATPHFATDAELNCVPMVRSMVAKAIEGVVGSFKTSLSRATCQICGNRLLDLISTDDLLLMYYLVNSRSVYCDPRVIRQNCSAGNLLHLSDEPNMALAPFLDLFNHSDSVATESHMYVDDKSQELRYRLVTQTELKHSGQLFINYGNHDNFKLLLEYGFIIDGNQHEKIDLSLGQVENFMQSFPRFLHAKKVSFIKSHQLHVEVFISAEGLSYNLETVLRIFKSAALTEKSLSELVHQRATSQVPVDESVDLEVALYSYLIDRFQRAEGALQSIERLTASGRMLSLFLSSRIRLLSKLVSEIEARR